MKNFRLFAAALLASTLVTLAPAQPTDDFAALHAKAEKGNGIAQYNVGLAYADGRGVTADRLEAFVWLSLARENGARGRALDNLIGSFDQAALEAAKQRLVKYKGTTAGKKAVANAATSEAEGATSGATSAQPSALAGSNSTTPAQQIAALTADKKQLSEEVAKAWKEIDALNNTLNTAQKSPAASSAPTATPELEKSLAAAQADLTRTKAELASQSQKVLRLAAAEAARLTPSAEMATLRNQLSAAQAQTGTLTTDLAAVRASETTLHDTIAQLTQEKAQLSAAPTPPDLSGKVRELEGSIADAAQKLSTAETAQATLQRQLADATASAQQAASAGVESTQLRHERDEFSNRVTILASENAQLRADRERLQKSQADSASQLRDATADATRIKELESRTANLQAALGSAHAEVSNLNDSLSARPSAPAYPDLSNKVRDLETKLAATNRQADAAVQTAVTANQQSTADLNAAAAQIAQLQAALAAKPAASSAPDLSNRVRELENQLAASATAATRAKQELAALSLAKDEATKNRGPAYPNLAGRVIELQTALTETKRDLSDAQTALRAAEQARAAAPVAVAALAPAPTPSTEPTDLQKQLAETEEKLATALRGYAVMQRDHDTQNDSATKSAEAVTAERNTLAAQVTALSSEVEQLKAGTTNQAGAAQAEATRAAESLAALQRSTAQNASDLAAARALLQQVQGSNAVLANENYQLKTRLAATGGSAPTTTLATVNVTPVTAPGAARTPVTAPAGARIHVVATGDTLSRISQLYYSTPGRWQEIYKANAAKLGPTGALRVGAELVIP